jgi:hypothetical protein
MSIEEPDEFHARPAHRRVGLYLIGIAITGILASIMVFVVTMQSMGWPGIVVGGPNNAGGARTVTETAVAMYVSPSSRSFYTGNGGNYDTLLSPWRAYFTAQKIHAPELATAQEIADLKPSTLILPSAVALSDEERRELLAFRDRGGSVLLTWASGTRNGSGTWVGADFLVKMADTKFLGEITKTAEVGHLIVNGESAVSLNQNAGKRIWIGNNAELSLRLKGPNSAGQFLNWSRIPERERIEESAVSFVETGDQAGRVVVFGFAESSWEHQPADIHALVNDAIAWLQHKPGLIKAAWPDGKRAAQIIEMDAEQGFPNALTFAAMLKNIAFPGAFYALSTSAAQYPDVLKALHRDFEVGYHGDVHTSFKDLPEAAQRQRLAAMQAQIQTMVSDGKSLQGFRAPTEGFDKTTEILLLKSGIKHHVSGPNSSAGRLPFFAPIADTDISDGLIVLPRTQRDDLNLLAATSDAALLARELEDDFKLTRANGALGLLSVHSQNLGEGQPLTQAMTTFLGFLQTQRDSVWFAGPKQVDAWWRDRERVRLIVRPSGPRIEFDLSVGGDHPVKGTSLILSLPRKNQLPTIAGAKLNMPTPRVVLLDEYRASIIFDTLEPGNYFYQATF